MKDCTIHCASSGRVPFWASSLVGDVLQASPSKMRGDAADRLAGMIVTSITNEGWLEVKTSCRCRFQVYQTITDASTLSDAQQRQLYADGHRTVTAFRSVYGRETGLQAQSSGYIVFVTSWARELAERFRCALFSNQSQYRFVHEGWWSSAIIQQIPTHCAYAHMACETAAETALPWQTHQLPWGSRYAQPWKPTPNLQSLVQVALH